MLLLSFDIASNFDVKKDPWDYASMERVLSSAPTSLIREVSSTSRQPDQSSMVTWHIFCLGKQATHLSPKYLPHFHNRTQSCIATIQKIACAFGGDETPPGMFRGIDVKKKVQRPSSLQILDNPSRSNISPMNTKV